MTTPTLTDNKPPGSTPDPLAGLPALASIPAAAKALGISRASAYRYADAGHLPIVTFGRRRYVVTGRLRGLLGGTP